MKSKYFKLQAQMINVGIVKGLTHPETIKCSQELDMLINQFQKINLVNSEMEITE
ncbi:aspartyl-phosphate phosphatase Spo0E family protein [Lysinibacillus antri]|uniref:Aspartyl-phosphate phosphatase Spo0E family protein n=2 Tax=Bacillaceae TaxID=186817 RepID=A0A3S0PM69_9BACI|nr:aspartyl-phosphate phosphatase Spo0E family protein [Lysinibacillus antri]TSI07924.1 aspartyl-phosphate phosphatase Spo0E family protein [Lysinibacillus sp. BW-2-10]